jgi:hypothetical protein
MLIFCAVMFELIEFFFMLALMCFPLFPPQPVLLIPFYSLFFTVLAHFLQSFMEPILSFLSTGLLSPCDFKCVGSKIRVKTQQYRQFLPYRLF